MFGPTSILRNFKAIQRRNLPRGDIFLDSLEQIHEPSPPSALFQDAIPLLLGAMQLTLLFAQTRPNRPSLGRLRFAVIVIAVNHVIALLYTNLRAGRAEIFSVFKILFVDFKLSPGLRFPRFVIRRANSRFQGSADSAHRCLIKGRHIVIFDDFPIAIQNHPPGICAVLFAFHQKKPSVLNDLRVDHTPSTGFVGDNIMFRLRRQRRGIAVCPSKEAVKGDGFTVFPEVTGDGRPRPQHQYVSCVDAAEFVRPLGKAGQLFIERCRRRSGLEATGENEFVIQHGGEISLFRQHGKLLKQPIVCFRFSLHLIQFIRRKFQGCHIPSTVKGSRASAFGKDAFAVRCQRAFAPAFPAAGSVWTACRIALRDTG